MDAGKVGWRASPDRIGFPSIFPRSVVRAWVMEQIPAVRASKSLEVAEESDA